ncbi:MAG: hypothetical protein GX935_04310 [Erysipelotrichia bacterium]|nr:hypothetical protein [Erysipelotrichia bacterium]
MNIYRNAIEDLEKKDFTFKHSVYLEKIAILKGLIYDFEKMGDELDEIEDELSNAYEQIEKLKEQIKTKDNLLNKYQDEAHIKGDRNYEKYRKV